MLRNAKTDFVRCIGYLSSYKARFIANSSSCTTTELSKLLTSCLTAFTNHVIRYCEKVYERSGKNLFWSIKILVLNKLKSRGFRATSLSTYDFSTLYTTLPHNIIKEKLKNLIHFILPVMKEAFFTSEDTKRYKLWSCQNVCEALIYLLDNIYIRFGTKLYRQSVGIPMGTHCAPLVADLFLFSYERYSFINKGIEFFDLHSIFKDRSVTSSIPAYFQNSEPPIICYKYNKPIRNTVFDFNKLVSDLDIHANTPKS